MVTYNVSLESKVVLVTGAAGFIGANLVKRLLNEFDSVKVIGIDNITEYYDVRLNTNAYKNCLLMVTDLFSLKTALLIRRSLSPFSLTTIRR